MTSPSLDALRDIHLPPPPLLASIPLEWFAVAALAALAAAFWCARRFMRRRALRGALRELAHLAHEHARDHDTTQLARGVSQLVRHYAAARFAHAGVEGLTGADWLRFLDAHGGGGAFREGVGAALESRPYQCHGEFDAAALIALVRRWLKANP